jgi:hypothetical protein
LIGRFAPTFGERRGFRLQHPAGARCDPQRSAPDRKPSGAGHVVFVLEAPPYGPHGRLERSAPEEGDLGLVGTTQIVDRPA